MTEEIVLGHLNASELSVVYKALKINTPEVSNGDLGLKMSALNIEQLLQLGIGLSAITSTKNKKKRKSSKCKRKRKFKTKHWITKLAAVNKKLAKETEDSSDWQEVTDERDGDLKPTRSVPDQQQAAPKEVVSTPRSGYSHNSGKGTAGASNVNENIDPASTCKELSIVIKKCLPSSSEFANSETTTPGARKFLPKINSLNATGLHMNKFLFSKRGSNLSSDSSPEKQSPTTLKRKSNSTEFPLHVDREASKKNKFQTTVKSDAVNGLPRQNRSTKSCSQSSVESKATAAKGFTESPNHVNTLRKDTSDCELSVSTSGPKEHILKKKQLPHDSKETNEELNSSETCASQPVDKASVESVSACKKKHILKRKRLQLDSNKTLAPVEKSNNVTASRPLDNASTKQSLKKKPLNDDLKVQPESNSSSTSSAASISANFSVPINSAISKHSSGKKRGTKAKKMNVPDCVPPEPLTTTACSSVKGNVKKNTAKAGFNHNVIESREKECTSALGMDGSNIANGTTDIENALRRVCFGNDVEKFHEKVDWLTLKNICKNVHPDAYFILPIQPDNGKLSPGVLFVLNDDI